MPAKAILLNPGNWELFGWTELFGLAVEAREGIAPKRFRIDCDASAFGIEQEVASYVEQVKPVHSEPAHSEPTPSQPAPSHAE